MENDILDIFNSNAFSVAELSMAVDLIPPMWDRIGQLNLFPDKPVGTTSVAIELRNNQLNILPTRPRGGPASVGGVGRRSALSINIAHIPHEDTITSDEVQNVRAFGLPVRLETLMDVTNRKLEAMRRKHDITIEHLRAGAMQGIVLDADGSTPILNLFTLFGVSRPQIYLDLAGGSVNLVHATNQIKRWMKDKLLGDTFTGIRALCAPDFFDSFLSSAQVTNAYKLFTSLKEVNVLRDDLTSTWRPTVFPFEGIEWEEYRAYASVEAADGSTTSYQFLPAGTCCFVPYGTRESFQTAWAPPTFLDLVNTAKPLRYYARAQPAKFNTHVDIHTQSNPMPICTKPLVLINGNAGTGSTTSGLT